MDIISRQPTTKGPAETFTGDVWVDGLFAGGLDQAWLAIVRHWHGAAPGTFIAHLVLMDGDGSDAPQTVWGEAVTDAEYAVPAAQRRAPGRTP
ncbi:hypothetical protein [Catenulispora rubra]|uniref:hypothetical protein n=1 Tax=Catenulispora rubra TaxID=280293 RepID=UPI0018925A88|nr:hypothetical protein [Catenulispora rubra]